MVAYNGPHTSSRVFALRRDRRRNSEHAPSVDPRGGRAEKIAPWLVGGGSKSDA